MTAQIERFEFNASANLTSHEKTDAFNFLREAELIEAPLVNRAEALRREAFGLCADFVVWAEDYLDIELGRRVPNLSKIKVYSHEEWVTLAKKYDRPEGWAGGHVSMTGEFLLEEGELRQNVANLGHELTHAFSRITLRATRNGSTVVLDPDTLLCGFENTQNRNFMFFNEAVTELIKLDVLNFHRNERPGKDYISDLDIGYVVPVIAVDLMLETVARKLNMPNEEIKKRIFRGYFEGDLTSLQIINDALGEDTLKTLAYMRNPYILETDTMAILDKLGVDRLEFLRRVVTFQVNRTELELYTGVTIKRSSKDTVETIR